LKISDRCLSDVCLSVAYIVAKWITEMPSHRNNGTDVVHITRDLDTTDDVRRLKVNVTVAGAYCGRCVVIVTLSLR